VLEIINQRKQAKLQGVHNPSPTNGNHPNNVRRESNKIFRNKKGKNSKR